MRLPLITIGLLWFSLTAHAELALKVQHPIYYTVAKGDTLWNIASQFLHKPEQWPQLWQENPAIANPNLIYPGDVLVFARINGKPQVSISQRYTETEEWRYTKVQPHIRITPVNEAIKLLPTDAIDQFLTSPRVVSENELETAPYVLTFVGEHLIAGVGDRIYARGLTDPDTLNYTIYHQGHAYIDPDTQKTLGFEAEFIADSTLQNPGDPAMLLINKAVSEVRVGDRLMPSDAGELNLNYFPRAPEKPIRGSIINVLIGVSQIGQYNVVVLNRGQQQGLAVGHVLDIYRKGKQVKDNWTKTEEKQVTLPDQLAGTLMVFRVFEQISYALVMQAREPIHVFDSVRSP